jgi:hypothetical protein
VAAQGPEPLRRSKDPGPDALCYQIFTALLSSLYLIPPQSPSNKSVPFSFPFSHLSHPKGTGVFRFNTGCKKVGAALSSCAATFYYILGTQGVGYGNKLWTITTMGGSATTVLSLEETRMH